MGIVSYVMPVTEMILNVLAATFESVKKQVNIIFILTQ